MKVEPIPGEATRFFVASESRKEIVHVVDLDDDGKPNCSCEDSMARGRICKHIRAVQKAKVEA